LSWHRFRTANPTPIHWVHLLIVDVHAAEAFCTDFSFALHVCSPSLLPILDMNEVFKVYASSIHTKEGRKKGSLTLVHKIHDKFADHLVFREAPCRTQLQEFTSCFI